MTQLQIPKKGIIQLYQWLAVLPLHGNETRQRSRFLKLLKEHTDEVIKAKDEILDKNSNKKGGKTVFKYRDEQGKEYSSTDRKDGGVFDLKDKEKAEDELNKYLEEKALIDNTPERQEMLQAVRKIILESTQDFAGVDATHYNDWCEAFEKFVEV